LDLGCARRDSAWLLVARALPGAAEGGVLAGRTGDEPPPLCLRPGLFHGGGLALRVAPPLLLAPPPRPLWCSCGRRLAASP